MSKEYINLYSENSIKKLYNAFQNLENTYYDLVCVKGPKLKYKNEETHEYLVHGFMRRMLILHQCIKNIYKIYPPEREEILKDDERIDLEINLHSFVLNVFGCIDNLAWIFVKERAEQMGDIEPKEVDFRNKKIKPKLSSEFKQYFFCDLKKWFESLKDFRDALSHRIPFYIPPLGFNEAEGKRWQAIWEERFEALRQHNLEKHEELKKEQDSLGRNFPIITHSFNENSPQVKFHAQCIVDFLTICEIANKVFEELDLQ